MENKSYQSFTNYEFVFLNYPKLFQFCLQTSAGLLLLQGMQPLPVPGRSLSNAVITEA